MRRQAGPVRRLLAAACSAVLLAATMPVTGVLAATLLHFDDLAHGDVLSNQLEGLTFNNARVVRCAEVQASCASAYSGANALIPAIDFEFDNEPLIILFDQAQASVSMYVSSAIAPGREIKVVAFNDGASVESATVSATAAWSFIEVTSTAGITAVEVTGSADTFTDNQFAIDDLSYEAPANATPEPTSDTNAAPTIRILTPADGLELTGRDNRIGLSYEVRDDGVLTTIEEWLWYDDGTGNPGEPVQDPTADCSEACLGFPYRGAETVFLPSAGEYIVGVRAKDEHGNLATEFVRVSWAPPPGLMDLWVMGIEWNQAVQDVVYTDLDRAAGTPGARTVVAGGSRVPIVPNKAIAVRAFIGMRPPSSFSLDGVKATGQLVVSVERAGETTTIVLDPVTSTQCGNHLEPTLVTCENPVFVPLPFGRPQHPRDPERAAIDNYYDVTVDAATDFDLDIIWRRLLPARTLNFVVPSDAVSQLEPGDRVSFAVDVEPVGYEEATAGDNVFTIEVEDIAPPTELPLRIVRVRMPGHVDPGLGSSGAPATAEEITAGLNGILHLVPYSRAEAARPTTIFYDGAFTRLRLRTTVTLVDQRLNQCDALWLGLWSAFGLDAGRTLLAFTPPRNKLVEAGATQPISADETDCTGIGWRVSGQRGMYLGGIAHTRTPTDDDIVGWTGGSYRESSAFWSLVAVGAQELYHAQLDRRHVGNFHEEFRGCFVDDNDWLEYFANALGFIIDSACSKPPEHHHARLGQYPVSGSPLRGDLGALGLRIEGDATLGWRLTVHDPCPTPVDLTLDPNDSIPWLDARWSVFVDANDCRQPDDNGAHDFMSYGPHRWTSVEQFSPLNLNNPGPNPPRLPALDAAPAAAIVGETSGDLLGAQQAAGPGLELTDGPSVRLWGVVTPDGGVGFGEVMPIEQSGTTGLSPVVEGGDVYLDVTRVDGSTVRLAVTPTIKSAHGTEALAFFLAEIPAGAAPSQISLVRDGETWTSIEASRSAPDVRVLEPNGGESWNGADPRTVRWQATDADGGELSYRIEFSTDRGTTWTPIGTSTSATSFDVLPEELPSSAEALIRVVASDGLRFTADVSDATFCNQVSGACDSTTVDVDLPAQDPVGILLLALGILVSLAMVAVAFAVRARRRSDRGGRA